MRYLNNDNEFRTWLIEVAFMVTESELERSDFVISYEEDILPELKRLSPESYPCIVYMENEDNHSGRNAVRFIMKSQVEEWAVAMKIDHTS